MSLVITSLEQHIKQVLKDIGHFGYCIICYSRNLLGLCIIASVVMNHIMSTYV